ncbi:MAG TPA: hypothetical protein VJB94_03330 [Candidatus Nanoarchaeia archaeon]|nr:hypothetical protein [Candidatus Nanoarchaeia archaeon]
MVEEIKIEGRYERLEQELERSFNIKEGDSELIGISKLIFQFAKPFSLSDRVMLSMAADPRMDVFGNAIGPFCLFIKYEFYALALAKLAENYIKG